MKTFLFFCFLGGLCGSIDGSRILCYLSSPSKSHVMLGLPICEELAARGHQVVTVMNHNLGKETLNFTKIFVEVEGFSAELKELQTSGKSGISFKFMKLTTEGFRKVAVATLGSSDVQKIMKTDKFDLILFMNSMINNVQIGLADHFKAPYISLSPMGNMLVNRRFIGSPSFPSTVPAQMIGVKGRMNFKERIINFVFVMIEYLMSLFVDYVNKADYEKCFPSDKYRSYDEMVKNNSLFFMNSHFSDSGVIRPLLPNEVELGGIQIKTKPAPLTGELKKFLDEAKDGAILWTFGSNVEVSTTQPDKVDIMLKALSKLKQRVVLKWEIEDKSRLPKNVLAQKWLPQDSILAHPNVKLFIGHGGAGGLGEAKYNQVPILGMPFFGDQNVNMAKIESEGWGRSIILSDVTEENFSEILNDMLTNQKYRDNVKVYSDKYRDRIASALDTAVFWVEYVLKHHGAPHLQYPGINLNFFQRHSVDVLVLFAVVIWIMWKLLKCLVKFCCCKGTKDKEQQKNDKKKRN